MASSVSVSGLLENHCNQERARHVHKKWAWEKLTGEIFQLGVKEGKVLN